MQEDISNNLQRLTPEEKQALVEGISLDAARVLKKLFPNNQFLDILINLKSGGFSNV